ncbi:sensory rhodopsin transducer [Streptomyces viridochromogenes]|uniref:sensory rhodopsin transducer n=1 Tax=Streptomyces viridochromogenes TaxID=1938 RepID=UPI0002D86864|nr:sensory rhodopsin transducer [Streptomyces viridochromogenes]
MSSSAADSLRPCDSAAGPEPSSDRLDALLRELSEQPPGPRRSALRDHVICLLLPLARRVTRRFRRHGEEFDDLVQVASVGLIKAVDGYDPTRGHAFLSYALAKVTGELRRHLRDRTALVRLPRPLQEASSQVFLAVAELEQRFGGRSPTSEEIAEHTGLAEDRVRSTLRAVHECRPRSLDEPAGHDQDSPLACLIGGEDTALGRVVDTVALTALVKQLPERDRRVLYLRFYGERTQQQIADVIGVSQMQVSRILRRCLDRLREALLTTEPVPGVDDERRPVTDEAAGSARSSLGRCRQAWPVRRAGLRPGRPAAATRPRPVRPGRTLPAPARGPGISLARVSPVPPPVLPGPECGAARRSCRALSLRWCRGVGAAMPPRTPRPTAVRRMATDLPPGPAAAPCCGKIARPPPAGPYTVTVPARRTLHQRFNELSTDSQVPVGADYASVLVSDVPVVVQHTRLDSRQPSNALLSTIAYAAE